MSWPMIDSASRTLPPPARAISGRAAESKGTDSPRHTVARWALSVLTDTKRKA